tara:strand:- start:1233 stop:1427 length:195 start_codon:yes stop_codon:yes gene_type:complete
MKRGTDVHISDSQMNQNPIPVHMMDDIQYMEYMMEKSKDVTHVQVANPNATNSELDAKIIIKHT